VRERPAGDFNYELQGIDYAAIRQPDPRFGELIRKALGDAKSLLNVGAGAGSYEPEDLEVVAVEPSGSMRAQRPPHLVEAIDAVAENLPFADDSFDASMASITIHQWRDLQSGLREMRRVTKGPVVIFTFEPVAMKNFWLSEYAPEMMSYESGRMPRLEIIEMNVGGNIDVMPVPVPVDCRDGFAEAFYGRPEAFLDERVRRAQSAWGFLPREVEESSVDRLRNALEDGSWDEKHGALRTQDEYLGSLRLIVSTLH
jgi:SAM-dependent methyltransferase